MKKQTKKIKLSPTKQLVLALVLFAVSVLLSRGADMTNWEQGVFSFVYGLPGFLHPFFFVITQAGTIYFAGLSIAYFAYKKKFYVVTKLLLGGLIAYLASGFAKDIWGRPRPFEFLENVTNLDYVVRGPGFPSGHTALATVTLLTIMRYLPKKLRSLVLVLIALVALSRLYLGIHAPLDVIGGFAIGWAAYALVLHLRIYDVYHGDDKHKNKKSI